jgi:hypothetical protein
VPTFSFLSVFNDFLILLLILGLTILYVAVRGQNALAAYTLSLYISLTLFRNLPFQASVGESILYTFLLQTAIVFGAAFLIHIPLTYVLLMDDWSTGFTRYAKISLLVLASTCFIFAILYVTLALGLIYSVSPIVATLFDPQYFFWWILAPILAIILISRP